MIREGKYVFREGKSGDRPASGWANQSGIPTFVLEYEGKQIGAAHGSLCFIILIQVFDEDKGHGTKFIELWEKYAKDQCSQIEVSAVGSDKLEHILKDKRGFSLKEVDEFGDKTYTKNV